MKQRQNILSQGEPVVLMAVPSEMLEQIIQKLDELSAVVKGGHPEKLGDWILRRRLKSSWEEKQHGSGVVEKTESLYLRR